MWLEEAKKRAEDVRRPGMDPVESIVVRSHIVFIDAPRAYEMLERVREIGEGWPHANTLETADKLAALFRDLEGKEAPDARDDRA